MANIKFKGKIKVVLKQKAYGKFGYKANIFNKIAKPYTAIKCFANADFRRVACLGIVLKALQNEFKSYQWHGFLGL